MRILVVGKSGQVARSLTAAAQGGDTAITARGRPELDLADPAKIERAIDEVAPDVIINAAAHTAVDQAENEEAAAHEVNAAGPRHLAELAGRHGIPLIHISTDYVFDGMANHPYAETDAVAPMSAYGRSKLAGEDAVVQAQPQSLIVRTAWVISPYGKNFCKTMLRLAGEHTKLRVVGDQVGSPTYAPHLAVALIDIAKRIAADPAAIQWGVYHLANSGYASWYDVAVATMDTAARHGSAAVPVEAITTAEYPTPARRPANSCLNCAKAATLLGVTMPHWQDGVAACVAALATE